MNKKIAPIIFKASVKAILYSISPFFLKEKKNYYKLILFLKGIPAYFFQKNFNLVKTYIMTVWLLGTRNCIISMC